MTGGTSTRSDSPPASATRIRDAPTPTACSRVPTVSSTAPTPAPKGVTPMVEPEFGPQFRVYCEACDIERTVGSRVLAQDMVDGHENEEYCSNAEWEAVDDG